MSRRKLTITIAALAAIVAITALLVSTRGWIAHRTFLRAGTRLESRLNSAQQKKYAADMHYTLDKFWEFYEKGLVSRNELNDVMEKMKRLRGKEELADMDIFDFIGYVSMLYTEAMRRRQSDIVPE